MVDRVRREGAMWREPLQKIAGVPLLLKPSTVLAHVLVDMTCYPRFGCRVEN